MSERAYQRTSSAKERDFAERLVKRRERRRDVCYRDLMQTATGRFVLAELIIRSGARKSPFDPHGSLQSANIGRMEVGLELDRYLQLLTPRERHLMWREWDEIDEREAQEIDAAQTDSVTETMQ